MGPHQLIDLGEGWVLDVQAICGDPVQGCVVQHYLRRGQEEVADFWEHKEHELCLSQGSEAQFPLSLIARKTYPKGI